MATWIKATMSGGRGKSPHSDGFYIVKLGDRTLSVCVIRNFPQFIQSDDSVEIGGDVFRQLERGEGDWQEAFLLPYD